MFSAGFILFAALLQAPSPPAAAAPPQTVKVVAAAPKAASDPDRVICRTENPTGSNIPTRVCHTAAQWDGAQKSGQELLNSMDQQSVHMSLSGH